MRENWGRGILCLAAVLAAGCGRAPELPVMGQVPAFELVAQDGRRFDRTRLDGKIWVADFIFTTCGGPCPLMSHQMRRVEEAVAGYPDVRLVSFTVDPRNDTPEVLAAYARRYQANTDRWFFLTGEQERLNALGLQAFKLNGVDGQMTHSTRFVLLDRKSRIRAYYTAGDSDPVDQVIKDIRRLRSEQS